MILCVLPEPGEKLVGVAPLRFGGYPVVRALQQAVNENWQFVDSQDHWFLT